MVRKFIIFIIIILVVFFAIVLGIKYYISSHNDSSLLKVMSSGETIELKDNYSEKIYKLKKIDGGFTLVGYPDKIVIIDFFATYCPPCRKEAPDIAKLQKENRDIIFIGIDYLENVEDSYIVDEFVLKFGAYYFIANPKNKKASLLLNSILKDINYYRRDIAIPFKVVLYKGKYKKITNYDGKLSYYRLGGIETKVLSQELDKIKKSTK